MTDRMRRIAAFGRVWLAGMIRLVLWPVLGFTFALGITWIEFREVWRES